MANYTLNLTDEQEKILDELEKLLDTRTRAEVIRKAINIAYLFGGVYSRGGTVTIEEKGKQSQRIRLI